MPSEIYKSSIHAISIATKPLTLIEISHPILPNGGKIRLVDDNEDITSNGNVYQACRLSLSLPSKGQDLNPTASLKIYIYDAGVNKYMKDTFGAKGAKVRLIQVMKSTPNVIEMNSLFNVQEGSVNIGVINLKLSISNLFNKKVMRMLYTPETCEGIF